MPLLCLHTLIISVNIHCLLHFIYFWPYSQTLNKYINRTVKTSRAITSQWQYPPMVKMEAYCLTAPLNFNLRLYFYLYTSVIIIPTYLYNFTKVISGRYLHTQYMSRYPCIFFKQFYYHSHFCYKLAYIFLPLMYYIYFQQHTDIPSARVAKRRSNCWPTIFYAWQL